MAREWLEAEPFARWLNGRIDFWARQLGGRSPAAHRAVAEELGWGANDSGVRKLYRYAKLEQAGSSKPEAKGARSKVKRDLVEDALHIAGVGIWELYPELSEEVPLVERFCISCHEQVTTSEDLVCPWCGRQTESLEDKHRAWCPRCDKMRFPDRQGRCWRCGQKTTESPPLDRCRCGCGAEFPRFDRNGRRREWVRGHAPKAEIPGQVQAEPFADWVRGELKALDPIEALSSRLSLPREQVIDLLEGRVEKIDRAAVVRSLWHAGRQGQGKGMPARPGTPKIDDLYPEDARAKICPGCGGGKARQAKLCKECRRKADRKSGRRQTGRPPAIARPGLMAEVEELLDKGMSVSEISRVMLPRTPYSSAASLAQSIRDQLKQSNRTD